MRFYTTMKLGPSREKTPEGFLLCRDVPIARTGMQLYGPGETPIQSSADAEGMVRVHRLPDQVFRPETMASFAGKPLVIEHPDEDVTPENWKDLAKGVFFDPHRGVGAEDDLLLADALVYDPETIRMILEGEITEVSAGYDAGYVEDEEKLGEGYQVDILGNHVALVRNGRCGPRCSIRDELEGTMKTSSTIQKIQKVKDSIRTAFTAKDQKALDTALSEIDDKALSEITDQEPETHIHIHSDAPEVEGPVDQLPIAPDPPQVDNNNFGARFDAFERELKSIGDRLTKLEGGAGDGNNGPDLSQTGQGLTGDQEEEEKKKKAESEKSEDKDVEEETSDGIRDKATDSRYMEESVQDTVAGAEILTPGIELPDFKSTDKPKDTVAALNTLRKKSLSIFSSTTDGATMISELQGGKLLSPETLMRMSVHDTRALFRSAAVQMKQRNRDRGQVQVLESGGSGPRKVVTIADLNKRNREFWQNR